MVSRGKPLADFTAHQDGLTAPRRETAVTEIVARGDGQRHGLRRTFSVQRARHAQDDTQIESIRVNPGTSAKSRVLSVHKAAA